MAKKSTDPMLDEQGIDMSVAETPVVDAAIEPSTVDAGLESVPVTESSPLPDQTSVTVSVPEILEYKVVSSKEWVNAQDFPWLSEFVQVSFEDGSISRYPSKQLVDLNISLPEKNG